MQNTTRTSNEQTELQHLVQLFRDATRGLGVTVSERQLEDWSVVVHEGMSGDERDYHSIDHVFDVASDAPPIATIAGLFHDLVYLEVDGTLPTRQADLLQDVFAAGKQGLQLRPYRKEDDPHRALVEDIFGLESGPSPSHAAGLNEFLSAMLAVRSLICCLPMSTLVQVCVCIEATIPFRPTDAAGKNPPERLFERLQQANAKYQLGFSEAQMVATLHEAVYLANRDVAGFAVSDTGIFLDYTWRLLPESNNSLRSRTSYTIGDYRAGLIKMARFFNFLKAERVFTQFQGVPNTVTLDTRTQHAAINIEHAIGYLEAKIAALSVLYAIALLTGGDVPLALFVGDAPEPGRSGPNLSTYLQSPDTPCASADKTVFALLKEGRRNESRFDIKHSPLAAYIYAHLGEHDTHRIANAGATCETPDQSRALIALLPSAIFKDILNACAKIATTRAQALQNLAPLPGRP